MAKTSDEVLGTLLGTSLKVPSDKLAELKEADGSWKDDAPDKLLAFDADRVTALNTSWEEKLSATKGTLKREVLEDLEKKLRDEFGVKDAPAKGVDLVKHIVQTKLAGGVALTEEQVKAHPAYIAVEAQVREFPTILEGKVKERETALQTEFKTKAQTAAAIAKAKTIFQGMRPILPKNPEVAAAQMTLVENFIAGHKLQFVEDAQGNLTDIIPMKADGSGRLEDAHGHPVKYDDLVKQGAVRFFEFEQGEYKQGAPDPNGTGGESGGAGGGGGTGGAASYDPKTIEEYAKIHSEIGRTVTDRAERQKQWAALKAAGVKNGVATA